MLRDWTARRPRPNYRRIPLLCFVILAGCVLTLAYVPALADSFETLVFVQSAPPASLNERADMTRDLRSIVQPPVLPANEVTLDDDTPVIGVLASGRARAYLVEAFEHVPDSHIVNDLLGEVPISVTHCDLSRCTRVFTDSTRGRPLQLSGGGRKSNRLVLKVGGRLYRQETSEPVDGEGPAFPYREHPAELVAWGAWRRAHPETDVYMGSVDVPTPPEAGGPSLFSPPSPPARNDPAR